jgi:hypothetical protein
MYADGGPDARLAHRQRHRPAAAGQVRAYIHQPRYPGLESAAQDRLAVLVELLKIEVDMGVY